MPLFCCFGGNLDSEDRFREMLSSLGVLIPLRFGDSLLYCKFGVWGVWISPWSYFERVSFFWPSIPVAGGVWPNIFELLQLEVSTFWLKEFLSSLLLVKKFLSSTVPPLTSTGEGLVKLPYIIRPAAVGGAFELILPIPKLDGVSVFGFSFAEFGAFDDVFEMFGCCFIGKNGFCWPIMNICCEGGANTEACWFWGINRDCKNAGFPCNYWSI